MSKKMSKKILTFVLIFSILFGQLSAPIAVLAQEATASAQLSEEPISSEPSTSPTPSIEPSPSVSPAPTETPLASAEPEASSSATPKPSTEPTPQPSLIPSSSATPSATPTASDSAVIKADSTESSPSAKQYNKDAPKRERVNKDKTNERVKSKSGNYVEGEVLVKFKKNKINLNKLLDKPKSWLFKSRYDLEVIEEVKDSNIQVVKSTKSTKEVISQLKQDINIEIVEPNYIYKLTAMPNDPSFSKLWGLNNTGQSVNGITGKNDADIDAPEAWDLETSAQEDVIVAVIDTGIDYNHPDLIANLWDGSSCKDANNNLVTGGCPNHGWNFVKNDKETYDFYGHGTHVSGTIAGVANNSTDISGVSNKNNIKVMALKIAFDTDEVYLSAVVNSIAFAKNNGAKVINASFGGPDNSQIMKDSINSFPGLFIAAAGNWSDNADTYPLYPAAYDNANIVSVAATTQKDELAWFSNYGAASVDIGAPGENIYSTIPLEANNTYAVASSEGFETVTPPNIPAGYTATGDWGTKIDNGGFTSIEDSSKLQGGGNNNSLYADWQNRPYRNNADSYFTSPAINLSDHSIGRINFFTQCDTEYLFNYTDYMELQISSDGANWYLWDRWDELDLDYWNGSVSNPSGYASYYIQDTLPESFMTQNFRYRFLWHTDSSDSGDLGIGCSIDSILIEGWKLVPAGSSYDYYDGTSMAAPHVVGEAAMLFSYNPALTSAQVKDAILNTGDSIPALAGKTVTGKRINLYNAMLFVTSNPSTNADLSNLTINTGTLTPNFSSATASYSASVLNNVNSINVTPTVADTKSTIKINGATVANNTPKSVNLNVGENIISIVVTAESEATKTYTIVVTRAEVLDETKPVITITRNPNQDLSKTDYILTAAFDDALTKKYKINNGTLTNYTGPVTVSVEGAHTFYAEGIDAAGNQGTAEVTFTIDKTAPSVSIDSPVENARVSEISLIAFGISGGIEVECSIDNIRWIDCLNPTPGSTLQGFGSTIALGNIEGFDALSEGPFTFYIKSTDEAGNTGTASRAYVKDTHIPNAPGQPVSKAGSLINKAEYDFGFVIEVPLTTSEAEVGDLLKIYLGEEEMVSDTITAEHLSVEKYTFAITAPVLGEDGNKIITARIIDNLGRMGALSEALNLIVDTTNPLAPIINSISNINYANQEKVIVTGSAEAHSIVTVQLSDGTKIVQKEHQLTDTNYSIELDGTILSDGLIQVIVITKDAAENLSTQTLNTVIKDTIAPALNNVNLVSTNQNPSLAKIGDSVTLTFQPSEVINNIVAKINGQQIEFVFSNNIYSVTKLIAENDNEGEIEFEISYQDLKGNQGLMVKTTSDNSTVTIDKTAPVVTGVENGKAYTSNVTPEFNEDTATLNGEAFVAGTAVAEEGVYILVVTDAAGNTTTVNFSIDQTAPSVVISKTPNKDLANTDYVVEIAYDDAVIKEYKLDTNSWTAYTGSITVSTEGLHAVNARGTDAAGNQGEATSVTFILDKTAPIISGIEDGKIYNHSVTPVFNHGDAKLNGEEFSSGTEITQDGKYELIVTDTAENIAKASFEIDTIAPAVIITRSPDLDLTNLDYTISINYGDSDIAEFQIIGTNSATIAGGGWTEYEGPIHITASGNYTVEARGTDSAGNITTAQTTFELDKVAPIVTGVENGKAYHVDVTPLFNEGEAVLNGLTFNSGTTISEEGEYILIVVDAATNVTQIGFTIDKTAPAVVISRNPDLDAANADYNLSVDFGDSAIREYKLDNGNWSTYIQSVVVATEGIHIFEARGTDLAGNISSKQVSFRINKTVPTIANDSVSSFKNEPITIDSSLLLGNDQDFAGDILTVIGYSNAQNGEVQISGSGVTFIPTTNFIGTGSFTYTATDGVNNVNGTVYIVITPEVDDNQTVIQPVVEINEDNNQVVIVDTPFEATINVPTDVTNATLDLSNIVSGDASTMSASLNSNLNINANTSLGTVQVQIPAGITISGSGTEWNGTINVPTVLANSAVTASSSAGFNKTTTSVIEVGFGDVKLVFDKAVRLVIPGKAGQEAGYSRNGQFTPITEACSADSQAAADALVAEGDCKIDSGSDLVIWTKHFTRFATYTQTAISITVNPSTNSGSNNSSGGTSGSSTPRCEDTKPGSAPKLISVVAGENSVTLTWEKAKDPVTYYLVSYGTKSGEFKYGNPNVGDKNTTSYTIKGLSGGTTYYFQVRAGNNCMPGDFSNELSAAPSGNILDGIATDFQPGVLGEEEANSDQSTPTAEENQVKATKVSDNSLMWGILIILVGLALASGLFYYHRRTK